MARKEQTYRVNGKEISIVTCENAGAGRKGNKGVYFDDKTYVLKSNADATEEMIKKTWSRSQQMERTFLASAQRTLERYPCADAFEPPSQNLKT